jgi:hypothetical protein
MPKVEFTVTNDEKPDVVVIKATSRRGRSIPKAGR